MLGTCALGTVRWVQCVGYMSFSRLLDLRAEESRVIRHANPPCCGEASKRTRALSRVRTQAIGALVQGSYLLSHPSARLESNPIRRDIVPHISKYCKIPDFMKNDKPTSIFIFHCNSNLNYRRHNTVRNPNCKELVALKLNISLAYCHRCRNFEIVHQVNNN